MSRRTFGSAEFPTPHWGSVPDLLVDVRASDSGICTGQSDRRIAKRRGFQRAHRRARTMGSWKRFSVFSE